MYLNVLALDNRISFNVKKDAKTYFIIKSCKKHEKNDTKQL